MKKKDRVFGAGLYIVFIAIVILILPFALLTFGKDNVGKRKKGDLDDLAFKQGRRGGGDVYIG